MSRIDCLQKKKYDGSIPGIAPDQNAKGFGGGGEKRTHDNHKELG